MRFILFTALIALCVQAGPPKDPEVNQIESYCAEIENSMSMSAVRIFAEVSDTSKKEPEQWKEFISEEEREAASSRRKFKATAYVAFKNGRAVAADFMSETDPSAWIVGYCFREDGTLARIQGTAGVEREDISVSKMKFFGQTGALLFELTQYHDLRLQHKKTPPKGFVDPALRLYTTVRALPFHQLL